MAILFSGSNVEAQEWLDSQPSAVGHCENQLGILLGLLEKELVRREVPRKRIVREPGFRDDAADQMEISFGGEAVSGLHQFSAQGWVGEPYLVLFSECGTTTIFDDSRDSLPELMREAVRLGNLGGDPLIGKRVRVLGRDPEPSFLVTHVVGLTSENDSFFWRDSYAWSMERAYLVEIGYGDARAFPANRLEVIK